MPNGTPKILRSKNYLTWTMKPAKPTRPKLARPKASRPPAVRKSRKRAHLDGLSPRERVMLLVWGEKKPAEQQRKLDPQPK